MQTISLGYTTTDGYARTIGEWRGQAACAFRSAYANAATYDPRTQQAIFRKDKDVEDGVKATFAKGKDAYAIDAWLIHSACHYAIAMRKARPDGKVVFGGRKNLYRLMKGSIDKAEWKRLRLMPMTSIGDKTFFGNRHFKLSKDARSCVVTVYGRSVKIDLAERVGKQGELLRAVALLASLGEISVQFRLGKTLDITFDEMDLRKLPKGVTLAAHKDAALAAKGHKARGRPRSPDYVAPPNHWAGDGERPIHPEWRDPVDYVDPCRCVGIDLNPGWIGLATVENRGDALRLADTKVLDHALVELGLPPGCSNEMVEEALAKVCTLAIDQARRWNVGLIAVESGLGKLRSSGKNKATNRLINGWARSKFVAMLTRKARLAGIGVSSIWGGYSTTIGNIGFSLPDACASAAEMARRGLVPRPKEGLLPAYEPNEVGPGLWKDQDLLTGDAILRRATTWTEAHRTIKAAKLGVRRPHPGSPPGAEIRHVSGFAVARLGHRRRPGRVYRVSETGERNRKQVDVARRSTRESG